MLIDTLNFSTKTTEGFVQDTRIIALETNNKLEQLLSNDRVLAQHSLTFFIQSGKTFSPILRCPRPHETSLLIVDCQKSDGLAVNPTGFILRLYRNGAIVYTSPTITTGLWYAELVLTLNELDAIRWTTTNTTKVTGGININLITSR